MGTSRRPQPRRLPEKLRVIRAALGLSQEQMVRTLAYDESPLYAPQISQFEQGKREPPLGVLLAYARVAGLYVEVLIDDILELPETLPANPKSEGVRHQTQTAQRRRKSSSQ
jgi:transcriptional regulator with XRE-family HTH domain